MHNLPKLEVPGYQNLDSSKILGLCAEEALLKWWVNGGAVLSQQITIAMLPQTPQEFLERVFKAGYMMGWEDSRDPRS